MKAINHRVVVEQIPAALKFGDVTRANLLVLDQPGSDPGRNDPIAWCLAFGAKVDEHQEVSIADELEFPANAMCVCVCG